MKKPERQFRNSVTKYLSGQSLYVWAINDSYHAGVPDHYYSGDATDLWAEYKHFPVDRTAFSLSLPEKSPKLTRLQQHWLNSQYDRGRNVWVIVGMPSGGVILQDKQWLERYEVTSLLSRKQIAQQILEVCHGQSAPQN